LYLLRRGGPQARRLTELLEGERDDDDVAEALALLRCSPALAEARASAEAEVDRAKAALGRLPRGTGRLALEAVADQVFDRQV
jgi:geranylgeranyl pyrophosphate synthase